MKAAAILGRMRWRETFALVVKYQPRQQAWILCPRLLLGLNPVVGENGLDAIPQVLLDNR